MWPPLIVPMWRRHKQSSMARGPCRLCQTLKQPRLRARDTPQNRSWRRARDSQRTTMTHPEHVENPLLQWYRARLHPTTLDALGRWVARSQAVGFQHPAAKVALVELVQVAVCDQFFMDEAQKRADVNEALPMARVLAGIILEAKELGRAFGYLDVEANLR